MARSIQLSMIVLLALCPLSDARGLRSSHSMSDLKMNARMIRQELDEALRGALGHGHGIDPKQVAAIRATLAPIFHSLPKNSLGHVGAPVMRYIVQRYFSIRHGWIIKGFEPHANRSAEVQGAGILGSKVPSFIGAALEKELQHEGFAIDDVLTMIIVVERLIFDEVTMAVETAYLLNGQSVSQVLDQEGLLKVLESYLIVEMLERNTPTQPVTQEEHDDDRANILELYPNWFSAQLFVQDVVGSENLEQRHSKNPFAVSDGYSFDDAARIAQHISNDYGLWGNQECVALSDSLADMDRKADGRVPLADFYRAGEEHQEPPEYLRQLGALDESSPVLGPQVIIPNYVYGMSNCLSSTQFYSVCCLNACEQVLQQFEAHLATPNATPAEILAIAERMASSVTGAQGVAASLQTKLKEVAAHHGGAVPLHGRLFAQWLHYAFPRTCPFPHATGTLRPQTQSERMAAGEEIIVEEDERGRHLARNVSQAASSLEEGDGLWSFDEEVLTSPEPKGTFALPHQSGLRWSSSLVAVGILFGVLSLQKRVVSAVVQRLTASKVGSLPMHKSHHV